MAVQLTYLMEDLNGVNNLHEQDYYDEYLHSLVGVLGELAFLVTASALGTTRVVGCIALVRSQLLASTE